MQRTQINVRVPSEDASNLKSDVLKVGARQDFYVLEALRHFRRSLTIDQRRALFASGRKTVGRPVEVKAA